MATNTKRATETVALPENMNGKCPVCGNPLETNSSTARHSVRALNEERCGITTHDGFCAGLHFERCDALQKPLTLTD